MRILVIAATEREIDAGSLGQTGAEILVTGVGVPTTIYHLQKRLQEDKPMLVIQAGIAGSFGSEALGGVILVKQDAFADLGMEEQGAFRTLFQSGFADKDLFPFSNGWLVNPNDLLGNYHLPSVAGVTVNKVTDSALQRRQVAECFSAAVETMEGAALHYVCLMENIPFIQIRSISNRVGERDKTKWKFHEAITNLNRELHLLIAKSMELEPMITRPII
jgi:futalosine hydrolase